MDFKKGIIISCIVIFLSGCSVRIGGSSKKANNSDKIVYDCSVISDDAHREMTKRYEQCGSGDTIFGQDCRNQVLKSVCKPIVDNEN